MCAVATAAAACGLGTDVHGVVDVKGSPVVADEHASIDGCTAQGVVVTVSSGLRDVLRISGADSTVEILDPSGAVEQVSQQDCSKLQIDVHPNGTTCSGDCDEDDGSHDKLDGSLDAACTLPGGGTFEASVTFHGCG